MTAKSDSPLHWLTAHELGAMYRRGNLTAAEATRATLERIDRLDPNLHAFADVMHDEATARAERADEELAAGTDLGPLHGIPVAVKDLCDVVGASPAAGTTVLRGRPSVRDATVVDKLRKAGAVIVGMTQMTEGAYATHHPQVTPPVNPWNCERWTGISSSGSGVAVAAGMCVGAIGTDTGGSIRYPSSANALVGIKPTYGRVSRRGVFPLSMSLDHIGPMCRNVRDAADMLHAMAGHDPSDPTSALNAVPDYAANLDAGIAGVRVGIDERYVRDRADGEIADRVLACAPVLKDAGAEIVPVTMPPTDAAIGAWFLICAADARVAHEGLFPERTGEYGPELKSLLEYGQNVSGPDLARAFESKREIAGGIAALFSRVDLLLCPSLAIPIPKVMPDWNDLDFVTAVSTFIAPFNMSGSPSISLPCGFGSDAMPIGLQLVGRHFEEEVLCRAGFAFEQANAWHGNHPEL